MKRILLVISIITLLFSLFSKAGAQIITAGPATGYISACAGTASASPNIQQFTVSGSNLTAGITATAPTGFQVSLTAGSGYGNSVTLAQMVGTVASTTIYVQSAAAAPAGNITGNIVLSSTGVTSINVAVSGTVNALPTVNAVANQIVLNGAATTAINFTGTGNTFNWVNDTPGVGLPASGTGNIASFTAVNTGSSPVIATITATPILAGFAYIANENDGTVSVINIATNAVVSTIPVGSSPYGVSVSPDGNWAYVTNSGSNTVSVINTVTNSVVATIPVGSSPFGVSVSPDGSKVYVANYSGTVSVINTTTDAVITTIPVVGTDYGISVSPDGSEAYVANGNSNNVSVINTATNSIVATIAASSLDYGVSISPDGSKMYVVNDQSNTVSVVNTTTNSVVSTIPVGSAPYAVSVSPDGSKIYVTNQSSNTVSVINTATNAVVATIAVGTNPLGVSVSPDGSMVYVANFRSNSVSVINTITNAVVSTIPVGSGPYSLGNFIAGGISCTGAPVNFTITVNPIVPSITATTATGNISACAGTASASPNIQQFTVSGSNLTAGITATAPTGFQVSLTAIGGYGNSVTLAQTGGAVAGTTIYVQSSAVAPAGDITGNIVLSSTGATSVNVSVAGTVNALPTVNAVANQTILNGAATTAINFTGTGSIFNWVNNTPGIGLPASGTGNIASFTAVNTGTVPVVATVTVTPISAGFAYIPNGLSNTVSVINLATNKVVSTINVGQNPYGISASPDGSRVYMTNLDGTVSVINTATNTVVATIAVGSEPQGLSVSPDGSRVYVANDGSDNVSVINTATNTVINTIPAGDGGIAVSPDGSKLYVTSLAGVAVVDIATNTVITTIPGLADAITVSPDGSRVYVTNGSAPGAVSVINTATNAVIATIAVDNGADAIAISPDGSKVYVSNNFANTVDVINTATNTVVSTIDVDPAPFGISVSPDGSRVYVATLDINTVDVINTTTNEVISTIQVGTEPYSWGNFITGGISCSGIPVTFTITVDPSPPTITAIGTLSPLATTYGTASASNSFTVSGTNMTAGILVTPPPGFEVSTDNITFSSTVTVGAAGTIAATPVYIRLASATAAGSYSGNIVLSSAGAASVNVAMPASAVNPAPLTITANNVNKIYGTSLTGAPGSTAFTATGLQNSETIASVTIAYGTGSAANAAVGTYTGSVTASSTTGGTFTASNYTITYMPGDIVVEAAPLTITANNVNKTYGTPLTGAPGSTAFTATGLQNSETIGGVTIAYGTGSAATDAVGTYAGSATASSPAGGTFSVSNYTITYVAGDIIVGPASLTITANSVNKAYGTTLTSAPGSTAFTAAGLQNSETIGSVTITYGTGSAANAAAGSYTGSVTVTSATGGTFNASNYTITYVPGDITVGAPPAIATTGAPSSLNTIYGTASVSTNFNVSSTNTTAGVLVTPPPGFEVSTDNVTFGSTVTIGVAGNIASTPVYIRLTSTTPVGSYSGNIVLSGAGAPNVNVAIPSSAVSPAPLTISIFSVNKPYGKSLTGGPGSTAFTATGLQNSETIGSVTIAYGTGSGANAPVGTYTGSGMASSTIGGTFTASNYTITYIPGNIIVEAASLTITANNANKTYGTALTGAPGSTAFTATGLQNSETIGSVTIAYGTGSAANAAVGTYTGSITASSATGGSFNASNYTITYIPGDIIVGAASLTITANNVNKTYGTTLTGAPGSTAFTATGLQNSETIGNVTLAYGTGSAATDAVGTYAGSATASSAVGGTFSISNYIVTYVAGDIIVGVAPLTITANNVNKTYGTSLTGAPGSTAFTATGLQNSETVGSVTIAYGTGSAANATAGTYAGSVTASSATGGTFTPGNYTITYVPGDIIADAPPTIAITGSPSPLNTIYGTASVSTNFSLSATDMTAGVLVTPPLGFEVSTDNITFSSTVTIGASGTIAPITVYIRLTSSTPVGNYTGNIVLSSTGAASVNVEMPVSTVTPAPLTITADDKSKIVGEANPDWTLTYSGFVNNDGPAQLTTQPTISTTAITTSPPGQYPITVSGAASPNYTFIYVAATLTIIPNIIIPNAFTPNGDGVNDTWDIKYLNLYPNCTVAIFNRWGQNLFSSVGYGVPWDGTYRGAALPVGTYYYIVNLKDGGNVLSGFVAIIR